MSADRAEWAQEQLRLAGWAPGTGNPRRQAINTSVTRLLDELSKQRHETEDDRRLVAELFYKLASGHAIASRAVQDVGGRWMPFKLGSVASGSTVRVKHDAYEGEQGRMHNSMVGRMVAARGGLVSVQYSDSSEGTGHRHSPDKLEVLVKVR